MADTENMEEMGQDRTGQGRIEKVRRDKTVQDGKELTCFVL